MTRVKDKRMASSASALESTCFPHSWPYSDMLIASQSSDD